MDLVLAQTFLEVAAAGSLARAAERLHVTQAAVSARLQGLESVLGQTLFVRNKAGARLTTAGRAFLPYATQLTQTWEQAKLKVASHVDDEAVLSIGGDYSLWSAMLVTWLVALRTSRRGIRLRTQVDSVEHLLEHIQNGALDVAVLYSPHRRPGIESTLILEEELIAVSTEPGCSRLDLSDYVYVDWGPDFRAQHDRLLPELRDANTVIALGPLALRYMLTVGGAGYFRTRAVGPHLASGALHRVDGAPMFSYSIHAVFSRRTDPELLDWALSQLRQLAELSLENWA
jgi:DNA-binding transcriptional LysR family regulator